MKLSFLLLIGVIASTCLIKETSSQHYFYQMLGYNPIHEGASYFQSFFDDDKTTTAPRVARQSLNSKFEDSVKPFSTKNHPDDDDDDDEDYDDDSSEDYSDESNTSNSGNTNESNESNGRLLSPAAFNKISETLGALNTVGHFIVDMTRGQDTKISEESGSTQTNSVPDAILTLTKNVLGQNVTNTIEPLIKRRIALSEDLAKPSFADGKKKKKKNQKIRKDDQILTSANLAGVPTNLQTNIANPSTNSFLPSKTVSGKETDNRCRTPDGRPGRCDDLSSCPALLLDLGGLRDSLCFKTLFVPGVCCPVSTSPGSTVLTTQRPLILTTRPPFRPATTPNLVLVPQIKPADSTQRPLPPVLGGGNFNNIVDPEDCGQQEYSSGRIVGGIEAPNGQWPWLAAIFLHGPKRTEFWCGGSLVGTKYILTAAHCTRDSRQKPFAARQFTVRLGDIDLSIDTEASAPVTFTVKEVRAHEKFSRVGFYNDIAILVLDRPVRKSKYVIPVCIPKINFIQHRERLPGRRATVVGWGTTYYGGKESAVQRQADLPIWKNEDCDRAYFQPINENFLCAGYSEGGVDACQGDSGGPLMMRVDSKWTQLGIVSFGNKCGEPGYPGVYTRVSQYLDWIRDHTKD